MPRSCRRRLAEAPGEICFLCRREKRKRMRPQRRRRQSLLDHAGLCARTHKSETLTATLHKTVEHEVQHSSRKQVEVLLRWHRSVAAHMNAWTHDATFRVLRAYNRTVVHFYLRMYHTYLSSHVRGVHKHKAFQGGHVTHESHVDDCHTHARSLDPQRRSHEKLRSQGPPQLKL